MIADTLSQCGRYLPLSPLFATAFDYLRRLPPNPPPGRHPLRGDHCFALVQTYATKPPQEARFEAHRKYIDIQFLQAGCETILWSPLAGLTEVTKPYNDEKDVAFYATPAQVTPVHLFPGAFAIFFPDDGHAPGLHLDGSAEVLKVVIKIRV